MYNIPNLVYIKYNKLNILSKDFLEDTILNINSQNCIIITHHVPSYSLIDEKYKTIKMNEYNQWFYSNMDNFISLYKDKIKCWIYGHTHTPSTKIIDEIFFLCNPIGYPNENNKLELGKNIIFD